LALKNILYIDFVSYVCIIISCVHFSELQIRQAFSCPRPILILNLEALLFCFDKYTEITPHQIYFLFFGFCAKYVGASKWFKNVNFFFFFCLFVIFDERNVKYYAENIFLILFMYFQKRALDHILILNILFFNKLRQIIPEIRSERLDLLIFIFILKTPVHSAGYILLHNEFRSTQVVARQNIQVSFYIRSTGLWPNTWIHVSQSLAIIRNAIHILWPINATRD
jgi:hypothetical protein